MDLRHQLALPQSKKNCTNIVTWVANDIEKFALLMNLLTGAESRLAKHAAWPFSYIAIAHPKLLKPFYSRLFNLLEKNEIETAIKRNILRAFAKSKTPAKYDSRLLEICYRILNYKHEKPAAKAFSLSVIDEICTRHPALKQEFLETIKLLFDSESPAFKSRARKILLRG